MVLLTSLLLPAILSCVKSTTEQLTDNLAKDPGLYGVAPRNDGTNIVYLVTFRRDVEQEIPQISNLRGLFYKGDMDKPLSSSFLRRILSLEMFDTLALGGVKLSTEDFDILASMSQRLKYLDLAATTVTDDVLVAITKHAPLLEHLCVLNCSSLTRGGIVTAVSHGKNLGSVLVSHGKLTEQDIADLERRKPGVVHEYTEEGYPSPVDRQKK